MPNAHLFMKCQRNEILNHISEREKANSQLVAVMYLMMTESMYDHELSNRGTILLATDMLDS